jgi:adenylylsulfate kinase-like enzyme
MSNNHPKLILATGRPAAGKSTLGKRLEQEVGAKLRS